MIGKVGAQTRGVEKLLRRIGFRYADRVDPFDGGPHFTARMEEIALVARRAVRRCHGRSCRWMPAASCTRRRSERRSSRWSFRMLPSSEPSSRRFAKKPRRRSPWQRTLEDTRPSRLFPRHRPPLD